MSQRASRTVALLLISALVVLGVLSFDWRFGGAHTEPRVIESFVASGELRAGTGRSELVPPFPSPMGGYNTRGSAPFEGVLDTPSVRATSFEAGGKTVVVASAELVVLPQALRDAVLERLGEDRPDGLVLTATHTHSGPGGYWDIVIAEFAGVGPYDQRMFDFLADQIVVAIRESLSNLAPARIAAGQLEVSKFGLNRARPDGPVDRLMTAARVENASGDIVSRIVVFAAHPTVLHRDWMKLSGDWPSAFRRDLERGGGDAMLLQGAVGDVTWGKRAGALSLEDRVEKFGQAVAGDARGALVAAGDALSDVEIGFSRVEFTVPPADSSGIIWGPFEFAGSNVLHWLAWPGTAEVGFLRIGPLSLALVPGEAVSELGIAWRDILGGASVVSIANGYIGYIETPDLIEKEEGEAKRTYFGPQLAPRILEGLKVAKTAAGG